MYREYPKIYNYETLEYDRKSRSDDPLLSVEEVLAKHAQILDEYANKNLEGSIPEENKFKEVGSSETIDSRPEMLKLLKAIESPAVKAILVVEVQRLSRGDLEDAGRLIRLLRYTNTLVITPHKTYDLRDEYDREAFERELKRGNDYLEYYKKIQKRGRIASVKEGNYIASQAPLGYNRISKQDGNKSYWTLEINEEEAEIVRNIFNWYTVEGIGPKLICRRLESMGIKTKNGNDKWHWVSINCILQNVHYIGKVRWNYRQTMLRIENQEIKKSRHKATNVDEYLLFDGKHESIISDELFEKTQEIKGKKPRNKMDFSLKNPFAGLIFCKTCGKAVGMGTYGKAHNREQRLKCNDQVHCKTGSSRLDDVIKYTCRALRETIGDFEVRLEHQEDDSVKMHSNLIKSLEKKLKELEAKELLQWEAQYDPDESKRLPQHVFQKLNEKLLVEKDTVNKALCEAKNSTPVQVDYKDKVMKFTDALKALEDPEVSVLAKNKYLKEIIERMEYYKPPFIRKSKRGARGTERDLQPFEVIIHLKP